MWHVYNWQCLPKAIQYPFTFGTKHFLNPLWIWQCNVRHKAKLSVTSDICCKSGNHWNLLSWQNVNCYHTEMILRNMKMDLYTFCHFSKLRHRLSKSVLMETNDLLMVNIMAADVLVTSDTMCPGIRSHSINLVLPGYIGFNTRGIYTVRSM